MLVIVTKASDDYWYEFRVINTIEDLLKIYPYTIIKPNYFDEDAVKYWDNFKKEDIPKLKEAKVEVVIYDDYIE
jgi:hypothetical protein